METVIRKWDAGLGIRIPDAIVKNRSLKDGGVVEIREAKDGIFISPQKAPLLSEMLNSITAENTHSEVETGVVTGNELW